MPDVFITAGDVTWGKPDPEGYVKAAALLKVDPTDCLVLEDAPAGLNAGFAAGSHVLAVSTSHTAGELRAALNTLSPPADQSTEPAQQFAIVRDLETCEFALDPDRIRVQAP